MSLAGVIALCLSSVGGLLLLARVLLFRQQYLDSARANALLMRLIESNNLPRAIKVCNAEPKVIYLQAVARALFATAPAHHTGERSSVEAAVKNAFDEHFLRYQKQLGLYRQLSLTGLPLLLFGAGLPLAYDLPTHWGVQAISAMLIVLLTHSILGAQKLAHSPQVFHAQLLPAIVSHVLSLPTNDQQAVGPYRDAQPPPPDTPSAPGIPFWIRGPGGTRQESVDNTTIKIGTLSSAHLCIQGDNEVSRMHAVIEIDEFGQMTIVDLGSSSGTALNGTPINRARLTHGDEVRVGQTTLLLGGVGEHPATGAGEHPTASNQLHCAECAGTHMLRVDKLTPDSGSALAHLRMRVCRDCGHARWFVEPQMLSAFAEHPDVVDESGQEVPQ
ncbi:MAG: FHA domain-containing protein [Deltaproteobacteria bacterium]|nr:FHA domain-containing protein [Deltaproteobacteria bacterium]